MPRSVELLPPITPWPEFRESLDWQQGEHVSIVGPTGSGKSTFQLALLPRRTYSAVIATKPRDSTLDGLVRDHGYRRMREWEPRPNERHVLLWPRLSKVESWRDARPTYQRALERIYTAGNWSITLDEARVVCDERRPFLGLAPYMRLLWTQGRSLGVSIVAGTQRPAWVPPEMFDQATHLVFFRDGNANNLKTIGGLVGLDDRTIRDGVPALDAHELLYVNPRTGRIARTRVEI